MIIIVNFAKLKCLCTSAIQGCFRDTLLGVKNNLFSSIKSIIVYFTTSIMGGTKMNNLIQEVLTLVWNAAFEGRL